MKKMADSVQFEIHITDPAVLSKLKELFEPPYEKWAEKLDLYNIVVEHVNRIHREGHSELEGSKRALVSSHFNSLRMKEDDLGQIEIHISEPAILYKLKQLFGPPYEQWGEKLDLYNIVVDSINKIHQERYSGLQ